jgi:hypothetical protein
VANIWNWNNADGGGGEGVGWGWSRSTRTPNRDKGRQGQRCGGRRGAAAAADSGNVGTTTARVVEG